MACSLSLSLSPLDEEEQLLSFNHLDYVVKKKRVKVDLLRGLEVSEQVASSLSAKYFHQVMHGIKYESEEVYYIKEVIRC